jgi:hypothetical protein
MGILGTQYMGRTKTSEKTEGAVMNGQSRETGNTHWVQKTQNKNKHNTILKEWVTRMIIQNRGATYLVL